MANVSLSQLTSVQSNTGTDLLEISKEDQNSVSGYVSRKTTAANLADYANTTKTYSGLSTTSQTIVGSLNECFQSVSDGKTLIAAAITDKGVQTAATDSFSDMATNIGLISGGGVTPTGTINISTNGVYDVTQYASANVSVSGGGGYPSRTVTFSASSVEQIPLELSAIYFKNGGRTISINVNGTTTTHTSVVDSGVSESEVYYTTITTVVGTNTIVLSCQNNDVYFTEISVGSSKLPPLEDSVTVYDSTLDIYVSTIGLDQYITSASSVYPSTSVSEPLQHAPNRPFDGSGSTGEQAGWHPQSGAPQWIQLELPRAIAIAEFTMKNRSGYGESPGNVTFQASSDGNTWTDITSFTFSSYPTPGVEKTVQISDPQRYQYYRWYYTSVQGNYGVTTVIDVTFDESPVHETW